MGCHGGGAETGCSMFVLLRFGVVLALVVAGLVAPPAVGSPRLGSIVGQRAVVQRDTPMSVAAAVTAKRRPRATVAGSFVVRASGKVRVTVTSNAKKVTLTYRTAKSKKRTSTIKLRKGKGSKTLAKGSKKIYARAKATSTLRASTKIRVGLYVAPPVPALPAPAEPMNPPGQTPTTPSTPDPSGTDTPPADTTPPGPVSSLVVEELSESTVTLSWTDPIDADLAGVLVRRAVGPSAPDRPGDGNEVPMPLAGAMTVTDANLSPDAEYSYALFSRDTNGNVSNAATISTRTLAEIREPVVSVGATSTGLSIHVSPRLIGGPTWRIDVERRTGSQWVPMATLNTGADADVDVTEGIYRVVVPAGQHGYSGAEVQKTWFAPGTGTPEQVARAAVEVFVRPGQDLEHVATIETSDGDRLTTMQYTIRGIPVLGAQAVVGVEGQDPTTVNNQPPEATEVDVLASVTSSSAQALAVDRVAADMGASTSELLADQPELLILEPFRLGWDTVRVPTLAWSVEVGPAVGVGGNRRVFVDAHSGAVLAVLDGQWAARDRRVCDAGGEKKNFPCSEPTRSEGEEPGNSAAVNSAYDNLGDAYDYFKQVLGRDSYDGSGGPIRATVEWPGSGAWYEADSTDKSKTKWQAFKFAGGYEGADDIVAHEFTHGVTHFLTPGYLVDGAQSGALNEGLSDIFGELVDQWNSRDGSGGAVRWEMGEDLPGGEMRYFASPANNLDSSGGSALPGASKVGGDYWMWSAAPGERKAHYVNLGVAARFAYLATDGGAGVRGIGSEKAARVIYRSVRSLTPTATFAEFGSTLNSACSFLRGKSGITDDDCQQVRKAVSVVGMALTTPPNARGGSDYIARDPATGRSVLVTADNVSIISSGGMFNCLARTRVVWDIPTLEALNRPVDGIVLQCGTSGVPWTFTPTAQGGNTGTEVILRNSNRQNWFIDAAGEIQPITDGGTYLCLAQRHPVIWNTPDASIQAWTPPGATPAECTSSQGAQGKADVLIAGRGDTDRVRERVRPTGRDRRIDRSGLRRDRCSRTSCRPQRLRANLVDRRRHADRRGYGATRHLHQERRRALPHRRVGMLLGERGRRIRHEQAGRDRGRDPGSDQRLGRRLRQRRCCGRVGIDADGDEHLADRIPRVSGKRDRA